MRYSTSTTWIAVGMFFTMGARSLSVLLEMEPGAKDSLALLALIGSIVAMVATLITGVVLLIVVRSNSNLKKEIAVERAQLAEERARKEREELVALEKAREARRIESLADQYRERLRSDPFMSQLKILTMDWPLDLISVYVQLVLHQQQKRPQFIHEGMLKAETIRDPNVLLRASQLQLESRANAALPPDEAIRLYRRCVIVGNPGAGKTTLLKYLALKSAARQLGGLSDVPIHVDLNAFASHNEQDFLDFAARKWDRDYGFPAADARKYMEENLQTGNALLLLDGLDETLTGTTLHIAEEAYKRITTLIGQTASRYHQACIVVTARIAGYRQRLPLMGFTELEILDFRPRDIEQFVNNWFNYHPQGQQPKEALELNDRLKQTPRIQSLVSNPLLLALVVLVYDQQQELPDLRTDLYKQCVETLLSWDSDRGHPEKRKRLRILDTEEKRRLLIKVAWNFHQQGQSFFPQEDLLKVIEKFLNEERILQKPSVVERVLSSEHTQETETIRLTLAEKILEGVAVETGLLKEYATEWYGFLHLTLQEYFVSQEIDGREDGFSTLLQHIGEAWWEEVLLLYAGSTRFQDKLLTELLEHEDRGSIPLARLFHTNLLLAGRCLAAHPRETELWSKICERLFDLLTTTPYSLTRQQAAEALAELDDEEINRRLLEMIIDEQLALDVRISIVNALAIVCNGPLAETLAKYLANDLLHLEIRIRVAQVFSRSAVRFVAHQLIELLERRRLDDDIRVSIAATLGMSGEIILASKLVPLLTNTALERGVKVRCSIADAIGTLGDTSVIPSLRQLLLLDKNTLSFPIRWHIIVALGALGQTESFAELLPLLYDDKGYSLWMRREIMDAIGSLRLLSLVSDLLPLLITNEIDWQVRVSIAIALGAAGDRSIIPQLIEHVSNERINANVRTSIATILGSLCDSNDKQTLRRMHVDRELYPHVYRSLFTTRCRLGDTGTTTSLLRWLTDDKIELAERLNILDALAALQDNSIVPELLQLLEDTRTPEEVQQSIATILVQFANDATTISEIQQRLEALLSRSTIADDIHRTLWTVSRRGTDIQAEQGNSQTDKR
jgi:HEAT repeat protein